MVRRRDEGRLLLLAASNGECVESGVLWRAVVCEGVEGLSENTPLCACMKCCVHVGRAAKPPAGRLSLQWQQQSSLLCIGVQA
jgi:hypothetical protein